VEFVGISPPGVGDGGGGDGGAGENRSGEVGEKAEAMLGVQLTLGVWKEDPHGVGEELAGTRRERNGWGLGQWLFLDGEERARSGVDIRLLGDGSEVLAEGGRRPWAGR
jgi:folylpolyglutamate synthase